MITIVGVIISLSLYYILKRDRESTFLTETELRDIECELNLLFKGEIEFNIFNLDKMFVHERRHEIEPFDFIFSGEILGKNELAKYWEYNKLFDMINKYLVSKISTKMQSVRFMLDFANPLLFLLIWLFLFLYTIYQWSSIVSIIIAIIIGLIIFTEFKKYN
jgi:hypothetical protein